MHIVSADPVSVAQHAMRAAQLLPPALDRLVLEPIVDPPLVEAPALELDVLPRLAAVVDEASEPEHSQPP
jgi:hypothetical protein